jgi:hypothetical protein
MITIDHNEEYMGVCINGDDTQSNIYNFCSTKMQGYDMTIMSYCKLDMCNLCCVTMDNMKKKSYSFNNVKSCYDKCARGKNIFNYKFNILFRIR